ncbi:MAG: hypothetical protein IIX97_00285 [Clostridia bacterium]|nr:hypothetical protein [Clostridia bacterium]
MFIKKCFSSVLAFCLVFLNVICLASCSYGPKTPEALLIAMGTAMSDVDSYEVNSSLDMKTHVNSYEYTCKADSKDIVIGLNSGEFYYYGKASTTVESPALGIKEDLEVINSYDGGKYLICTEGSGISQNIFSEMTDEEAREYVKGNLTDTDVSGCDSIEMTKNEDETYTLVFSGFKKDVIDSFTESAGIDATLFEKEVKDIKQTVIVDVSFFIKSVTFELVFDTADSTKNIPEAIFKSEYSNYGKASKHPVAPDFSESQKVYDVRVLATLRDMLAEKKNSNEELVSFRLKILHKAKYRGRVEESTEEYTVRYGVKDSGYFYDVQMSLAGNKYRIRYEDGKQTVTYKSNSKVEDQTETEARAFIGGLISTVGYNASYISDIQKNEENVYKLASQSLPAAVSISLVQDGGSIDSSSNEMTFKLVDGQIKSIKEVRTLKLQRMVSGVLLPADYTMDITLTFN